MHIAVTHLMPPEYSPTGGAIALSVAVVKPDSRGTLTLRSRDPREQPDIDCNFLAEDRDARRMVEGVRCPQDRPQSRPRPVPRVPQSRRQLPVRVRIRRLKA
jgi:choline dehydrogenase-like flavoprotein